MDGLHGGHAGGGFPRVLVIGTTRNGGQRDFCVVYGQRSGLLVELDPERSDFASWLVTGVAGIASWTDPPD